MIPLESMKLLADLTPAELAILAKVTREITFAAGETIFKQGDAGDGIYFVKGGLVQISAVVPHGDLRVLSRVNPGDLFGEMAVLDSQPRSANATAEEPTTVYFIARDDLWAALERTPKLSSAIVREISRRLREFNQTYMREVLESERLALVGRFASSIVHDLKNPLNIIGISADMACMDNSTPEKRSLAQERIRKQIWRINDMVGDILEYTRSSRADTTLVPGNYADFIKTILPELQAETEAKSAPIELQNEPPAIKLLFDPRRLRRVFFNLVHNATDFMLNGGKIFLRFNCDEKEIVTEIEDTGPGIAPAIADNLFQPFATHGKSHGTGLGLSICKKIIEDHKGRIWTRSEPKRGAIFCFALPLAK